MRIFVTGGTGFVGTHVLAQALAAGHQVTALRRPGSQPRLPLAQQPDWLDGGLDQDWSGALAGHDLLLHLAAHTCNPPYDTLAACLHWNVQVPLALAEQARLAGVRRFLVAGSCFEYGKVAGSGLIPEDAPLAPNNDYATSKAVASVAFEGWARTHGLQLQLMRIFHVYGPGEPAGRFWPALRQAALEGRDFPMSAGAQVRDFVAVESVARQFVRALDMADVQPGAPRVRHVGSGQPQTLLDFARYWWAHWQAAGRLLPGALPYRAGEIMHLAGIVRGDPIPG